MTDSVPKTALLAVAVALVAVACATTTDFDVASGGSDGAASAVSSPSVAAPPRPTSQPRPTPTATVVPTPTPTVFALDLDLALKLPDGWSPVVDGDDDTLTPSGDAPGGGVVPRADRGGNRWKYTGVLGKLKPKQRVVPAGPDAPAPVPGAAVLTGVSGQSPARPAVIVKIDNVPLARPQTGLNEADIIYEELVEAGVTRFAAVFHSQVPSIIGPVRSGRSTDIGIMDSFNRPIFAFSGANSIFDRLIDKQPIFNRGAEVSGGYWRNGSRPAPHNLYTGADTMLGTVSGGDPPGAHFAFRAPGAALHPEAVKASTIRLTYLAGSSAPIEFRWNKKAGGWQRWQSGTRHVDSNGVQLAPENVVVQVVNYIDTGMTDKWGEDLYEGVSVGAGAALVFTKGRLIEATWTRSRLRDPATFTDDAGNHIELTPGQTFVALIAPGGVSWS